MLAWRYFDTSYLVPLVMEEATSEAILAYLSRLDRSEFATSLWTRVELNSLLGIRVRQKLLTAEEAQRAEQGFRDILASFELLTVGPHDFEKASEMLREYDLGLRAGDALHLAVAQNNGASALLSLDKRLLRAGRRAGMHATTGIPIPGYEL